MKTFVVGVLVSWLMTVRVGSIHADYPEEIPFVPTPIEVVDKMLELAEVKKGDVLYDLGRVTAGSSFAPRRNTAFMRSGSKWTNCSWTKRARKRKPLASLTW